MKRGICLAIALLISIGLLSSTVPASAQDSKLHIKFSTWHPPASREVTTVWIPMLEELKKRSDGRIT